MADSYEIDPYQPELVEPDPDLDEPAPARGPAPPPLPRLWKTEPEPEPPPEITPARSKKRKREAEAKPRARKPVDASDGDGTGATKLEETPVLDTYEARQKARWIIGGVLGLVGLVGLMVVIRAFRGGGEDVPLPPAEVADPRPDNPRRINADLEARTIVSNARQADRLGKTQAAVDLLEKVAKTYQGTGPAREAMVALDRHRMGLPLFGADVPNQATGPKPPPAGKTASVVSARPPENATPGATAPTPPKMAETPNAPTAPTAPSAAGTATGPSAGSIAIKPLPIGFREKPGAATHPSGWPSQIVSDRDGAVMVLVPGGTFLMGREDGEDNERPAHRVFVSTYYIDQHEVTTKQFVQFLRETGRPVDAAKLLPKEAAGPIAAEDLPVVNVSSQQAKAYCNWALKRLPTEAQWEYAARSSDGRISYWNGELPRKDPPKGVRAVEAVMSLPSDVSPFGAYDMAANAWEWTSEFWDSQYYQQFRNLAADPTGPKQSRSRPSEMTVKGGSRDGALTWREGRKTETRLPYLGFRGALPVEGTPVAPAAPATATPRPNLPGGVVPF